MGDKIFGIDNGCSECTEVNDGADVYASRGLQCNNMTTIPSVCVAPWPPSVCHIASKLHITTVDIFDLKLPSSGILGTLLQQNEIKATLQHKEVMFQHFV